MIYLDTKLHVSSYSGSSDRKISWGCHVVILHFVKLPNQVPCFQSTRLH